MASVRAPVFELHVSPLFRTLDRVHMQRLGPTKRVDLSNYDEVRAKHQLIVDFLTGGSPMPPLSHGGPWPQEWIDLFVRWRDEGFRRLSSGTGTNYQIAKTATDRYLLSCDVTLPNGNAQAWFEIVDATSAAQNYRLVAELVPDSQITPVTIRAEERIRGPLSVAEVFVTDSAGVHAVPFPTV
jgi:hypothetical protein